MCCLRLWPISFHPFTCRGPTSRAPIQSWSAFRQGEIESGAGTHLSHKGYKCIKDGPLCISLCRSQSAAPEAIAVNVGEPGPGCSLLLLPPFRPLFVLRTPPLSAGWQPIPPALDYEVTDRGYSHFPQQRNLGPLVPTFLFWRCICPHCSSQCS